MKILLTATALALALTGCATSPDSMSARHVSPMKYQDAECSSLAQELSLLKSQERNLHASLKKKADNDKVQATVGMLLLWPTLFFLEGGDGADASEYKQVKGDIKAIETQQRTGGCL